MRRKYSRRALSAFLSRRIFLALGLALFVAGASLLSVGVYNYLDQPDRQGLDFLREVATPARQPEPEPISRTVAPAEEPSPTPQPTPQISPPTQIIIEAIDVDALVMTLGLDANNIPEVPNYDNTEDASSVVAWYNDFSSPPGAGSNAVFAAHVTWNGPAVFSNLEALEEGDAVNIITQDGKELVYEVFANFPVDPEDPNALRIMLPTEEDIVTLITCGGTWLPNPSEEFGGSYSNRTIVQARLVTADAPTASAGG